MIELTSFKQLDTYTHNNCLQAFHLDFETSKYLVQHIISTKTRRSLGVRVNKYKKIVLFCCFAFFLATLQEKQVLTEII